MHNDFLKGNYIKIVFYDWPMMSRMPDLLYNHGSTKQDCTVVAITSCLVAIKLPVLKYIIFEMLFL